MEFHRAKREPIRGKPAGQLNREKGGPIKFASRKDLAGKETLERLGLPDQVQKIRQAQKVKEPLPFRQRGWQKQIQWQLWVYEPVMLFVDQADTTQYLAVTGHK